MVVTCRYDDKYQLSLVFRDGKTGRSREEHLKKSVANFIDTNGNIVQELVEAEVTKMHNNLTSERKEK